MHPTLTQLAALDDNAKLMLIDWLADSLHDDLGDELAEGLSVAFERVEDGRSAAFAPIYPAGATTPQKWDAWRAARDSSLVAHLLNAGMWGRIAAKVAA
jgi:hypothetical protein